MKSAEVIEQTTESLIEMGVIVGKKLEEVYSKCNELEKRITESENRNMSLCTKVADLQKRVTELETRKEWKPDENTFGG